MKDRKLASRYARAFLSVVREPRAREEADEFLRALAASLDESDELRTAMLDPAVPAAARKKILRSLAEREDLPSEMGNFLATLVDNNRIGALPAIAAVFHELRERELGIVPAELTTATPLAEDLRERVRATLERVTGRKVRLTFHVEPALLGGAVTRIGSEVYDGSLRGQLGRLKQRMARG